MDGHVGPKYATLHSPQTAWNKSANIINERRLDAGLLGKVIDRVRARQQKVHSLYLVATPAGQPLNKGTLRLRFDAARATAASKAAADGNPALSTRIKQFQFRDIRPKAASEIGDLDDASKLLGHTKQQITEKVYRRIGEAVKPTK